MKKISSFLFFGAFLLASTVFGQETQKKVYSQPGFLGGINAKQAAISIADDEAQDAVNVFVEDNSVKKRRGQVQRSTTTFVGTEIASVFNLQQSDGDKYCVVFTSASGYVSSDDCVTFTSFISTLTAMSNVDCAQLSDRLYCSNGSNTGFYFNGTDDVSVSTMPACKYWRAYQNRLWCSGNPTYPSRVYYSGINDGTAWDTDFSWVDFNPEDGDSITGIGLPLFETITVYKNYSTFIIQGGDADAYSPVIISANIGAKSHRTIKNFLLKGTKNIQVFDSLGPNGGRPGIYQFNGIVIQYLSEKIEPFVDEVANFKSVELFHAWASKDNWDLGTASHTSTSIDIGFVVPSTWGYTATTAADWGAGALVSASSQTTDGSITLLKSSGTFVNGGFQNATAGLTCDSTLSATDWPSQVNGVWYAGLCNGSYNLTGPLDATPAIRNVRTPCTTTGAVFNVAPPLYVAFLDSNDVEIRRVGLVATGVVSTIDLSTFTQTSIKVKIYFNRGVYSTTVSSESYIVSKAFYRPEYFRYLAKLETTDRGGTTCGEIRVGSPDYDSAPGRAWTFDMVEGEVYDTSGTWTSPILDTTFTRPIGGTFIFSDTVPVGSTVAYSVRQSLTNSEAGMGSWSLVSTTTSGAYTIALSQRYWQTKSALSTSYSTQTPSVELLSLSAASTGYWESAETFLSNDLTSWGLFSAASTLSGSGALTYQIKSSTFAGGTAAASYSTQVPATAITVSTGPYIMVKATNNFAVSTDSAKLRSIVVYYSEGASSKLAVAEVYKNRYYWFGQSNSGTYNDVGLVMDMNGAWTRLTGVNVRSSCMVNDWFFTGASNAAQVYQQDSGYSDAGTAIPAWWTSKDFPLTLDEIEKNVSDIFVTYASNPNSVFYAYLYGNGAEIKNWTWDLESSTPFAVKKLQALTSTGSKNASYHRVKFYDSSLSPFEILGFRLWWIPRYTIQP